MKTSKIAVSAGQKYRARGKTGHWRYVIVRRVYKRYHQPYAILQEITRTGKVKDKDTFPSYMSFRDGMWRLVAGYERVDE